MTHRNGAAFQVTTHKDAAALLGVVTHQHFGTSLGGGVVTPKPQDASRLVASIILSAKTNNLEPHETNKHNKQRRTRRRGGRRRSRRSRCAASPIRARSARNWPCCRRWRPTARPTWPTSSSAPSSPAASSPCRRPASPVRTRLLPFAISFTTNSHRFTISIDSTKGKLGTLG